MGAVISSWAGGKREKGRIMFCLSSLMDGERKM